MNRKFFRWLLLLACLTWGVAGWQLWNAWQGTGQVIQSIEARKMSVRSDSCIRDPFALLPVEEMHQKRLRAVGKALPMAKEQADSTQVMPHLPSWEGYMAGSPAMVILRLGSRTEIVKMGDSVLGWRVLGLDPQAVRLRCAKWQATVRP